MEVIISIPISSNNSLYYQTFIVGLHLRRIFILYFKMTSLIIVDILCDHKFHHMTNTADFQQTTTL